MKNLRWDQPIFVLGNPRSGTSLLRLMLHSHSEICIPPESHFFLWLEKKYCDWHPSLLEAYLNDLFQSTKFETWDIDKVALRLFLGLKKPTTYAFLNSLVYQFYALKNDFKATVYWGDKNSLWNEKLDAIIKHYPHAFFVHIVRDGRDVACSYKSLNKKVFTSAYAPKLSNDVATIADTWSNNVNEIDAFLESKVHNHITILYEQLLNNPKLILESILHKINLRFEECQVHYFEKSIESIEPQEFLNWKEKLQKPLDTNNIGKFEKELTHKELSLFNYKASTTLKKYGYL